MTTQSPYTTQREEYIEIYAPAGKLGVVIDTPMSSSTPIVHAIKDTCPIKNEIVVSDNHPVSNFMDQFYINLHSRGMSASQSLMEISKSHTQMWNNESYKKLARDILVHIGTNMLVSKRTDIANVCCVAQTILVLEHFNDTDDIESVLNDRIVRSKIRDLDTRIINSRRDALKFYRKRTTCKCLKKMHLEARKSTPKMGICWGCDKEMERVHLSVCSRCMVNQYCSRECQVFHWPKHGMYCDAYA